MSRSRPRVSSRCSFQISSGVVNGKMVRGTIFPFTTPEEIWNEHRELTRGRDLDITGLSYDILERDGPQQWPYPAGATRGTERLYEDGIFATPGGKARFFAERYKAVAEPVDARYPLALTTGRLRDHWHGLSRTGNVTRLFGHVAEPRLGMNAHDMARRGIRDGDIVRVQSRRGSLHIIVASDADVRSGQAYLPMHWGKRFLGGQASDGTNTVTSPALDPDSRQPELKHAAVKVSRAELPWRLVAFAEFDPARIGAAFDGLATFQDAVAFASAVLIGRDRPGILFRAAHEASPSPEWLGALDRILALDGDDLLRYDDARRGHARRIRISDERLLAARLSGDATSITSGECLRDWLVGGLALLSPAAGAPSGFVPRGRVVCQCFDVSEGDIARVLAESAGDTRERVETLKQRLRCGTNCGSCAPELRALAASAAPKERKMVA